MSERPERYGLSDEQEIEVEGWNDDLGLDHEIAADDPEHRDSIGERLWREAPEREREPREEHRLTSDGEDFAEDWGDEAGEDLSAEERAVRVDPDEEY
ncbi:hypothetical protein [Nonomuraea sediminis]|uniref:hypothetical protein n=1 Tax=Nonomuraea sediminis TaxID=2835864 RepID=UPI001BDCA550|nr:hypothetical protein [Nonomuraea sediminis]